MRSRTSRAPSSLRAYVHWLCWPKAFLGALSQARAAGTSPSNRPTAFSKTMAIRSRALRLIRRQLAGDPTSGQCACGSPNNRGDFGGRHAADCLERTQGLERQPALDLFDDLISPGRLQSQTGAQCFEGDTLPSAGLSSVKHAHEPQRIHFCHGVKVPVYFSGVAGDGFASSSTSFLKPSRLRRGSSADSVRKAAVLR